MAAPVLSRPNPSNEIADPTWWFWLELDRLAGADDELGGILAKKPGHHSTRNDNENRWPDNYSIVGAKNQGGPDNVSSAVDWTFKSAQRGDFSNIKLYSARLLAASRARDPRLAGLREWYGQADTDSGVEGWSFLHQTEATSDTSHLWHIHFSFWRSFVLVMAAYEGVLSVLRGESLKDYLARGGQLIGGNDGNEEDDTVTVFCKAGDKDSELVQQLQRRIVAAGGSVGVNKDNKPVFDGWWGDDTTKGLKALIGGSATRYGPTEVVALDVALTKHLLKGVVAQAGTLPDGTTLVIAGVELVVQHAIPPQA